MILWTIVNSSEPNYQSCQYEVHGTKFPGTGPPCHLRNTISAGWLALEQLTSSSSAHSTVRCWRDLVYRRFVVDNVRIEDPAIDPDNNDKAVNMRDLR